VNTRQAENIMQQTNAIAYFA